MRRQEARENGMWRCGFRIRVFFVGRREIPSGAVVILNSRGTWSRWNRNWAGGRKQSVGLWRRSDTIV
jgi:hypothetical protein